AHIKSLNQVRFAWQFSSHGLTPPSNTALQPGPSTPGTFNPRASRREARLRFTVIHLKYDRLPCDAFRGAQPGMLQQRGTQASVGFLETIDVDFHCKWFGCRSPRRYHDVGSSAGTG